MAIGVGLTQLPSMGRAAQRACMTLHGAFLKFYNRVEESNEEPGQPGHLLHSVSINSGVAMIMAIDKAGTRNCSSRP